MGNKSRFNEKNRIKSKATQNKGRAYPIKDKDKITVSMALPLCIPAKAPNGIPTSKDKLKAKKHSSNVAGKTDFK